MDFQINRAVWFLVSFNNPSLAGGDQLKTESDQLVDLTHVIVIRVF